MDEWSSGTSSEDVRRDLDVEVDRLRDLERELSFDGLVVVLKAEKQLAQTLKCQFERVETSGRQRLVLVDQPGTGWAT